jgi:hypothetical protein
MAASVVGLSMTSNFAKKPDFLIFINIILYY